MLWNVPTIGGIERTTAILTLVAAAALDAIMSRSAALGCVIGGGLMIANLFVLALLGRALLAMGRDYGGATGVGMAAAPLKMFLVLAIVYLIINSGWVEIPGFIIGILTQFAAIFIETWRVSGKREAAIPEGQQV